MAQADSLARSAFKAASCAFKDDTDAFAINGGDEIEFFPGPGLFGESFDGNITKAARKQISCLADDFEAVYPSDPEDYVEELATLGDDSWRIETIEAGAGFVNITLKHIDQTE